MQLRKPLIVTAMLFIAGALHADDRFEKTFSRTLTFRSGRVTIDHRFGSVKVRGASGNQVNVRAEIRASDADFGKQISVTAAENAGGIEIRTSYPDRHEHFSFHGNFSYSVELEVSVPENAPLTVRNKFGSIDVTGVRAANEILGGQGSVVLRNTRGARVENSFGSVEVEDSEGDLTINNANGSVRATRVRGSLSITDRFASIAVNDVSGDANIQGGNGSVDIQGVRGKATVHNSFATTHIRDIGRDLVFTGNNSRVEATNVNGGANITTTFDSVTLSDVDGPVRVSASNGNVTVNDVKGDVSVDNRFGSVRVERARGSADVDNGNGSVTVSEIGGNVKVHTTFASAFVKGAGGAVDVQNQNGAISVSGLRSPCHPITLNTTFSSIKVALPANASYDVSARTSFGHISSDIPITTTNVGDDVLTGRIGNGGCKLDLKTANGGITIGRE